MHLGLPSNELPMRAPFSRNYEAGAQTSPRLKKVEAHTGGPTGDPGKAAQSQVWVWGTNLGDSSILACCSRQIYRWGLSLNGYKTGPAYVMVQTMMPVPSYMSPMLGAGQLPYAVHATACMEHFWTSSNDEFQPMTPITYQLRG